MEIAAILAFLKNNWKWIAVGLAIASLAGYIEVIKLERDHYKKEYQETSLKLDTLVASSKAKQEQQDADNAAITAKYTDTLKTANTLVTENARLNAERIKSDKELASAKLSLNAIRVFNASKQPTAEAQEPTPTVSRNDGKADAVEKSLEQANTTLADLMLIVNENDANHLKCIKTVEDWQNFWRDYQASVEANNAE